jgi:phosphoserine phosphatase
MLIVFDVEGVLLNAEYLPILAKLLGPQKEEEIWEITKQGIRGDINWEEGLKKRVHALRGISYEDALKIAENLEIMPGAKKLCSTLKQAGWKMIAVSGGFKIITDRLKTDLGIDKIFSNDLIFKNNVLHDVDITVTSDKSLAIRSIIQEWGISKENIVVVIDGANDLKLLDIAGYGVGFCPVDIVRKNVDIIIDEKDLSSLLNILEERYGKTVLMQN